MYYSYLEIEYVATSFSPARTDLALKLLSNSNHKIAFDYDKDTMSLVEELTLDTLEVSLSDNTISSAGNATIAFEYHCYQIEADAP
jgi:hypothetical protein